MPLKLKKGAGGLWQAHGTVAGRRIRKSTGTRDKHLAQQEARRLEKEVWARRLDPQADRLTFEAAALHYMRADGEARFLAPLIQYFKGCPVDEIRPGNIQDAARDLYPGRKPGTWNRNVITPARAVLNFAADRGWCSAIRVKRFPEEPVERVAADREWLDKFMDHAPEHLALLAMFMFTTGARITEALNLEKIEGRQAWLRTKTGPRVAIMPRELMLRMKGNPDAFVYKSRSSVYNHWYKICDKAQIERIPPHQAGRHAFGTEMIVRRGIDPKTTAELGGWKSPRVLMERYAHAENLPAVVDEVFGSEIGKPLTKSGKSG